MTTHKFCFCFVFNFFREEHGLLHSEALTLEGKDSLLPRGLWRGVVES